MSTLIVLGGLPPSTTLAGKLASTADRIIAADSGYDHCRQCGLHPDVVTGDFDSISVRLEEITAMVDPAPEQNATDFEKALRHVPPGESTLCILGGTGLRSDHFLTNLLIASGRPEAENIQFHDAAQVIHRVTPLCPLSIDTHPGSVISLIPFTHPQGVTTRGLRWNLDNTDMGPPALLGQSNQAQEDRIVITLRSGRLFVVVNRTTKSA